MAIIITLIMSTYNIHFKKNPEKLQIDKLKIRIVIFKTE